MLGSSLEQQGQDGDGDVRMNAMRCPVKHRAHPQPALHRPPSLFHPLLLFVTKRHVFRCQRVIVAMHHELAVEALQLGHRLSVDHQAALCFFQQASVTGTGPQGTDPFCVVCFREIGQAGQFRLQFAQKFLAMRLLAFCFQVIEADRIAPPSLTIADERAAGESLVAQVVLDLGNGCDINRVAGEHSIPYRKFVSGGGHADHNLGRFATAVLAMHAPSWGCIGLLAGRRVAADVSILVALVLFVNATVADAGWHEYDRVPRITLLSFGFINQLNFRGLACTDVLLSSFSPAGWHSLRGPRITQLLTMILIGYSRV